MQYHVTIALTLIFQKNARGQVLIDLVFDFLELLERDFFGLQYNDFSCNPGPLLVSVFLQLFQSFLTSNSSLHSLFVALAGACEIAEEAA